ncbi:integral membrane protein [Colletotrichum salicis]|uniref:Integral membrane protein n=1 Tax=Colletotrichum salicis TaxID=1209931 RepID=A0A135RV07_9PEZI|nr:integral membrane protein [Colletotrichum salicis]
MRVATVLLFAAATQAAVSSLNSTEITKLLATTPKCAMPCFVDAFHSGNCTLDGLTDCVCTNITLQAHASACIQQACEFDDQVATARISQQLCESYPFHERRKFSKVFSIGLPVITILTVALRCLARFQVTNQLWWDDWTALIALAFLIVMSGLGYASMHFSRGSKYVVFGANLSCALDAAMGFGLHYWDIDPGNGKAILQVRQRMRPYATILGQLTDVLSQIFYALQMLYIFIQYVHRQ